MTESTAEMFGFFIHLDEIVAVADPSQQELVFAAGREAEGWMIPSAEL